jgi:1-acyl-sn-glycerol-3-phosphate acyltransferase
MLLLPRALLFYTLLLLISVLIGALCLLLWAVPYRLRAPVLLCFNRGALLSLRLCCGVRVRISGREHIPTTSHFVVMAKHQSTWETFFLQLFFHPLSTILKRELLRIPCFGWGLALMQPIPIDRSNPREAIRQVKTLGVQRLQQGMNILVFPEGTRTPLGQTGSYARSGADIAIAAGVPVLPVAHNAGLHWPMHTLLKFPGTIDIVIGQPIDVSGRSSRDVTEDVKTWIETTVKTLPQSL